MLVEEVSGPMMMPFTTSADTVHPQSLFGLDYYSSLLQQRAMMAPQLTEEEAEMVEMGPYYGMGQIDPETRKNLIMANRIAVPVWILAGFAGDIFGNRIGSGIAATAGAVITANLAVVAIGSSDYAMGGRLALGGLAAIAALLTVGDVVSTFKKKPDSPLFKTKLTRLSKAVGAPA